MVRITIRLPEEDLNELRTLSKETTLSISELVRHGVKQVLKTRGLTREELMKRILTLAGIGHSGLPDVAQRHDDYLAEAYGDYK